MNPTDVHLLEAWKLPEAQTFFRNFWPMYVHELAGFDTDFYRLDAMGRWQPDIVEDWLAPKTPSANLHRPPTITEPSPQQRSHIIVAGGVNAGFACVTLPPFKYMPPDVDVHLAELFVASPFRKRSVAQRAVAQLVRLYRGRWHLSAIHDNARALRFWRKALPALPIVDLGESTEPGHVGFSFLVP